MFERRRQARESAEEAAIRQLLHEAGERPALPAEDLAGIAAAARDAWQEQLAAPLGARPVGERPWTHVRARRPLSPRLAWGVAAAAVVAIGVASWWMVIGRTASAVTARADQVHGRVEVESPVAGGPDLAPARAIAAGDVVAVGSRLTTNGAAEPSAGEAGGVALRMPGGASLRLAEATRMRLLSAGRIELERGAVYIDHAGATASEEGQDTGIEVVTPFGNVVEIGTQFSVRRSATESHLEVRVREGEVQIVRPGATASASAGIELLVGQDGSIRRREIAAHGPEWDWVLDRAPGFDIEGRTLGEFLGWVGRETGWRIELSTAATDRAVGEIVLHGSTAGLRPDRAAFVVLSGADLAGERFDGTLRVRLRQGDGD